VLQIVSSMQAMMMMCMPKSVKIERDLTELSRKCKGCNFFCPTVYATVSCRNLQYIVAAIKSRIETFWYQLTQRSTWKMAVKTETEREGERERERERDGVFLDIPVYCS